MKSEKARTSSGCRGFSEAGRVLLVPKEPGKGRNRLDLEGRNPPGGEEQEKNRGGSALTLFTQVEGNRSGAQAPHQSLHLDGLNGQKHGPFVHSHHLAPGPGEELSGQTSTRANHARVREDSKR